MKDRTIHFKGGGVSIFVFLSPLNFKCLNRMFLTLIWQREADHKKTTSTGLNQRLAIFYEKH